MSPSAAELIEHLQLIPHPEGGHFRETFRSGAVPMASRGSTDDAGVLIDVEGGKRNLLTSIYWMPNRQSPVGWLCINAADHVHYYHAGAPVTYHVVSPTGEYQVQRLGLNVAAGEHPQLVVPGGYLKAAELTEGEYGLVGEAVAPGFDFLDFTFVSEQQLSERFPALTALRRFVKPDQRRDFERYYDAQG